jgi:hypothetical protein
MRAVTPPAKLGYETFWVPSLYSTAGLSPLEG